MPAFVDRTGHVYGKLTVLGRDPVSHFDPSGAKRIFWLCRCECGNMSTVRAGTLAEGTTRSCGCSIHRLPTTHGLGGTITYASWTAMQNRCYNKKHKSYCRYGAKGIQIKYRDITHLVEDVGLRPSKAHTIERLDGKGHYEPGNCVWATQDVQSNNKSSNHVVIFGGKRVTLKTAAALAGVPYGTVHRRLSKGATFSAALWGTK